MDLNFYKNLIKNLLEDEYYIIKSCCDGSEINEKSRFSAMFKQIGSVFNFIYIIRLGALKSDISPIIESFKTNSRLTSERYNIRNAVSVFIFIGNKENITNEVLFICEKDDFSANNEFMNIKWIVDEESQKLIIKGSQPNKIYGIEKAIKKSFESGSAEFDNLSQALKNNNENKKSYIKSEKITLTLSLILINIIIFFIMELYGGSENIYNLIKFGAIVPELIINKKEYFRLLSAMFIHIGLIHLTSNCFSLLILGIRVERYYGKIPYLIIYIFSGLICSLFSTFLTSTVSAGASGAVFGLNASVLSYTFFKKKSMAGIDLYMIAIMIILGFGVGFMSPNIDNFGHIGGFIGGLISSSLYLFIERKRGKQNAD